VPAGSICDEAPTAGENGSACHQTGSAGCSEIDVWRATRAEALHPDGSPRYTCQATQLPFFTTRARWWDVRQYTEDYTSGNVSLGRLFRGFVYASVSRYCDPQRTRAAPLLGLLYDRIQALWDGVPYPRRMGTLPPGQLTPTAVLDLQPGQLVRVKSYEEILATLDPANKNRGLLFDAEMVPYCGKQYRVKVRVDQFLDEKSGRLVTPKTPAIILEDVWCRSRYSSCRMFCPRSIYSWWREVWLEKVDEPTLDVTKNVTANAASTVELVPGR
jgi:hypothetical protein